MTKKKRAKSYVIAGAAVTGALALALFANSPSQSCAREQYQILVAGAYKYVPERARFSAKIMCERNDNVPQRFRFRKFVQS